MVLTYVTGILQRGLGEDVFTVHVVFKCNATCLFKRIAQTAYPVLEYLAT
jgi:hypothetical protein